ncbi:DUF86 domain-containing protein [Cryomorphaceae bacterium 1068]|nr:DUF86 domain-containing protein [Cryomorphaceae bacterium 1068]
MSKREDLFLVQDMLESGQKIISYTSGYSYDDFINDEKTVDAVIRNFEIIGEAASRISEELKNSNDGIPWKQLKGYRNRLIHEYFGVDYRIVWEVIDENLPHVIHELKILERKL